MTNSNQIGDNQTNNRLGHSSSAISDPVQQPFLGNGESGLPPIVHEQSSAYYHPQGIPVTSGDYEQRVKNQLLQSRIQHPKVNWNWRNSPAKVGAFLVTSTIAAVYMANIIMVFENVPSINLGPTNRKAIA